jgi:hypothetical protein
MSEQNDMVASISLLEWLDMKSQIADLERDLITRGKECYQLRAENRALREALRKCCGRGVNLQWIECALCGQQWRFEAEQRHAPGCLAAPQEPAQEGER